MKHDTKVATAVAATILLTSASPAFAYIGPGSGLIAVAAFVAVIAAVVVAVFGFLWYPLKRLLRRGKDQDADFRKDGREK